MTEATRDLLKRALELPPGERVKLAHELLGSVVGDDEDVEIDSEFAAELERRANEPPPPGGWPTGKEVLDEARARLRARRPRGG
jgi:putative addiction module component (TIGR02574 family)